MSNGYGYLTVMSIGSMGRQSGGRVTQCQLRSSLRDAAAAEAIHGSGPCSLDPGSRAGGGQLTGLETLCRSLAPPALHTMRGNPPADALWAVIKRKVKHVKPSLHFSLHALKCKLFQNQNLIFIVIFAKSTTILYAVPFSTKKAI